MMLTFYSVQRIPEHTFKYVILDYFTCRYSANGTCYSV
jgi:hypothetical protein